MVVLEMKGQHLSGNPDTEYKKSVLQLLGQNFSWDHTIPVGKMALVHSEREAVECDLVLMNAWRSRLPEFTAP
jgi:type III restriction enzyme